MNKRFLNLPETDDAREKLRVICPRCSYALLGLRSQRCPECGEDHGIACLWAHYLAKTKPGQFFNNPRNRPLFDIAVEPVASDSTALRYERRSLQTPVWLLSLGSAAFIASVFVLLSSADPNTTRGLAPSLFMLGAAFIGVGTVLLTQRLTVDITDSRVIIRDRIAGFESVQESLAIDAVVLSFEFPPTWRRKRWFLCVLFTQNSHLVLWAGKHAPSLRLYLNELPPPMKALHVSLINHDRLD